MLTGLCCQSSIMIKFMLEWRHAVYSQRKRKLKKDIALLTQDRFVYETKEEMFKTKDRHVQLFSLLKNPLQYILLYTILLQVSYIHNGLVAK